jgi:hypothetical protein
MTSSRHAVLRAALTGLGLGAAWGVLARAWMRLVSTEPEFSWFGTLMIVLLSAVFGLLIGLSWQARHATGWRRWLRFGFVPGLILFAGQGLPLAPGFLVGGPLLRRRSWLARCLAVVAIVGPGVLFWKSERLNEVTMNTVPLHVQLGYLFGMPLVATALAIAGHLVMGPLEVPQSTASPDRARSRRRSDSRREVPAGPA